MELSKIAEVNQQKIKLSTDQNIDFQSTQASLHHWVKITDFLLEYPSYSPSQIKWLLLHRKTNGLSAHVRRIGKPLYLNVPGFLDWIENRAER